MKHLKSKLLFLALVPSLLISSLALADASANIGYVSQYHYRGIQQTAGGSTSAGLDYSNNGFNIGTWAADVDDGIEVDIYGGYAIELESGITLGLSGTSYQYTGTFDSAYNELTVSAGFGMFSLDYSKGTWDGAVGDPLALKEDYSILILGVKYEGFSGKYGTYGDQFSGDYFDLSYSTTISDLDVGVGLLMSSKELDDDESLYFSLSKTFDF